MAWWPFGSKNNDGNVENNVENGVITKTKIAGKKCGEQTFMSSTNDFRYLCCDEGHMPSGETCTKEGSYVQHYKDNTWPGNGHGKRTTLVKDMTCKELRQMCNKYKIVGYSTMKKADLIKAVNKATKRSGKHA